MRKLWNTCEMTVVMVTHDLREAFTLATRVIAFERRRNRPEERERFGATIARDIEVWPPRVAGQLDLFRPTGTTRLLSRARPGRPGTHARLRSEP